MILVSVCIITYNHRPWIRQAVESVLSQKHDFELEILIGDDCSTDGTSDVLTELDNAYPGMLKICRNECNIGPGKNFWNILHCSKGRYIAFLEGDDYWIDDSRLKKQLLLFDECPDAELVVGNTRIIKEKIGTEAENIGELVHHKFRRPGLKEVLRQHYHISSFLMKREVISRFSEWYGKYGNILDIYHLCEAVSRHPAVYLDEIVSVRRVTEEGVYSKLLPEQKMEFDLLWAERLFEHFRKISGSVFYNRIFERAVLLSRSRNGFAPFYGNLVRVFKISPFYFLRSLVCNAKMLCLAIVYKMRKDNRRCWKK